jgi:hypothetical protein
MRPKKTLPAMEEKTTPKPRKKHGQGRRNPSPGQALIPGWSPKRHPDAHIPNERTRCLVETMTGYGASQPQIAAALDISAQTLARHYREELTLGHMRADLAVTTNLFRIATIPKATAPIVNAAIWWTKARMGWTEIRRTMADVRTLSANVRDLTDAELLEILQNSTESGGEQGALPPPGEPGEPS